ncbi:tannase/feruloyl esterase family alpha/beta hydrolase [Erwinia mallotivora]|uniref:tannase/feruloyl esterase family alpha/beta hydrolase n=1 Tax=Erwinia mallotivora TaxID=69222 RepID=UPI0035E93D3F
MAFNLWQSRLIQALAGLALLLFSSANAAVNLPTIKPVLECQQLTSVVFGKEIGADVKLSSTTQLKTAQGNFCKVSATLSPDIGVEVALPMEKWTQRMLQTGCGGLCGSINLSLSNADGCLPAMNGEFTVAATNMGHAGSMMDASWADDPQKRIDFAWRANHLTAQFTKALINAFYGQPPRYAYFMGCSDGGREALIEAQRYPDDFNGISAGAPAAYFSVQNSFYHGWNVVANQREDGTFILLEDRLPLIHQAAIEHCPTLSRVSDGILQNPFACPFSRSWVKQCQADEQDKSHCLTAEELDVVEKMYRGASGAQGEQFAPAGLPVGSELRWPVPASADGSSMSEMMALPALQHVLLNGKQNISKVADFALDRDNFTRVVQLAPLYNATNTNLKPFQQAGGKLLVWHGLADDSISPAGTIAWYRGVEKFMGEASVSQFMRLFLLPGVAHCGNGEGYDQIDLLTPLMAWTEQGLAPDKLISGKQDKAISMSAAPPSVTSPSGNADQQDASVQFHGVQKVSLPVAGAAEKVTMTRPVFPYPYIAQYNGRGDPKAAENYHPVKSSGWDNLRLAEPVASLVAPDNQRDYRVINGRLVKSEKPSQ